MQYTDDILKDLENVIAQSMETAKTHHGSYMDSLQGFLNTVTANRAELNPMGEESDETMQNAEMPDIQISTDIS